MADQLAGQWYADATGLGDLLPEDRIQQALRTIHAQNVRRFGGGRMGAVNGMRPDGSVDESSEQSAEVWVGTTYALAAFMIGRGLIEEGWETARGAAEVTYERGLWFRTPEAYDERGNFRASIYLRPLDRGGARAPPWTSAADGDRCGGEEQPVDPDREPEHGRDVGADPQWDRLAAAVVAGDDAAPDTAGHGAT
jgi:uncharacterized protein (DUF608 family)